jgi:DNA-binding MarR family transcriptional regulator
MVKRERMADDQRRVSVMVTARSRQLGRRMISAIEKRYGEIEKQVGAEKLRQAYEVLDALLAPLGYVACDADERDAVADASRR